MYIAENQILFAAISRLLTVPRVDPDSRRRLNALRAVRMKPDLVWLRAGAPIAVVDAKYKRETPAGYPEADVYQMLAYCTASNLRHGHLVSHRSHRHHISCKEHRSGDDSD